MKICLPVILILLVVACSKESKPVANPQVDALFEKYNNKTGPGCALAVVSNGNVIYKHGYGMANLEYDIPITTASVFDIASVSKQFAGLAISTLVDQGKISLDDDIHKYLPEVPDFGKKITIQHLVDHTSGIRDWPMALNVAGWRWDEDFTFEDIMRMVKQQKDLDFAPGEKFSYSNTGYNLLAAIVAKVSGKSFREWTDENIFAPLKMTSSHFLDDHTTVIKNMAYSYRDVSKGWAKSPTALTAFGSSSLFTSVDDLVLWVNHFNTQIEAKNPVFVRMVNEGVLNDTKKTGYAFGLGIDKQGGLSTVSHNGGWAGYRTAIINFPDEKLSVILLSNASDFDSDGKALDVAKIYLKDKYKEETNADLKIKDQPTVKVNTAFAQKCLGTYQLDKGWYVKITLENDTLKTQANGEPKFAMQAKSDSSYWIEGYGGAMIFKQDAKGDVNSLRYKWIKSAPKVVPITIDPKSFTAYTGTFHSAELGTDYIIDLSKDTLRMHHFRLGDIELNPDPVTADQFTSRIGGIAFVRDGKKNVNGLTISGGRVKNLRFDKR